MDERAKEICTYHSETKHQPHRSARSAGYLDWPNEPDPFRRFEGSPLIHLPFLRKDPEGDYDDLFRRENHAPQPFSLENIAAFLELSMGLSAWKSYQGSSWPLRMNPSSGNLHPTEAYVVVPALSKDFSGGVCHYDPSLHALEQRAVLDDKSWEMLQDYFSEEGFLTGLSSIAWREAWKYGERAFRYCNLDTGHAAACMSFSANLLGWQITYLNDLSDGNIRTILGFGKTGWKEQEEEYPDLMVYVHRAGPIKISRDLPENIIRIFTSLPFSGIPNLLSKEHREWPIIDRAVSATANEKPREGNYCYGKRVFLEGSSPYKAAQIIRKRRSAQAFDGKSSLSKEAFFGILDKTMPRDGCAPFDFGLGEINLNLFLYVHSVKDIHPGLYFLFRDQGDRDEMRHQCLNTFSWEKVKGSPEELPLYLLQEGDVRALAADVSCNQDIAGDSCFAVSMIARFRENIAADASSYRRLHWEAGTVGQVLYLAAEAHSMNGTGIGCFFDDLVHKTLGLRDDAYQCLYNFTVGKGLTDERLATLSPYHHLKK